MSHAHANAKLQTEVEPAHHSHGEHHQKHEAHKHTEADGGCCSHAAHPKHEADALAFHVFPNTEENINLHELEAAIREIKIKGLTWAEKFHAEDQGFGIQKLVVSAVIADQSVDVEAVQDAVVALHLNGKKMAKSVHFDTFNKICA